MPPRDGVGGRSGLRCRRIDYDRRRPSGCGQRGVATSLTCGLQLLSPDEPIGERLGRLHGLAVALVHGQVPEEGAAAGAGQQAEACAGRPWSRCCPVRSSGSCRASGSAWKESRVVSSIAAPLPRQQPTAHAWTHACYHASPWVLPSAWMRALPLVPVTSQAEWRCPLPCASAGAVKKAAAVVHREGGGHRRCSEREGRTGTGPGGGGQGAVFQWAKCDRGRNLQTKIAERIASAARAAGKVSQIQRSTVCGPAAEFAVSPLGCHTRSSQP